MECEDRRENKGEHYHR